MIEFACKTCGAVLHVADTLGGKKGKCQKCGAIIVVPTARADAAAEALPAISYGVVPPVSVPPDPLSVQPAGPRKTSTTTQSSTERPSAGNALKRLVRLPDAVKGVQYAEIPHNARLVRWGAGVISFWGWATLVVGIMAVIVGVLAAVWGTLVLDNPSIQHAAVVGFAWGAISFGFSSILVGILLVALAAFFMMLSHTCEAVRDAIIIRTSESPTESVGRNGRVQPSGLSDVSGGVARKAEMK